MKIAGKPSRTIWLNDDDWSVGIIDQTVLPHRLETKTLRGLEDAVVAIRDMLVRGAPLIGATAAYGFALSMRQDPSNGGMEAAYDRLFATRPTAVNLRWALDEMRAHLQGEPAEEREKLAYRRVADICETDVEMCAAIGRNGVPLIEALAATKAKGDPINILTHCNAGWLACVDWGTATAPIYMAHDAGLPVHVWVDETRPRNQGAALTAWELGEHGVPHTLITDNAGGHLMQRGMVDLCIVGTDRTTAHGDVCNKIGTYLKALAAADNQVPFYVALPSRTIDWSIQDGIAEIPIEQRDAEELTHVTGRTRDNEIVSVAIAPESTVARNDAFDVTPAELITGLITERGVLEASADGLRKAFPEATDA